MINEELVWKRMKGSGQSDGVLYGFLRRILQYTNGIGEGRSNIYQYRQRPVTGLSTHNSENAGDVADDYDNGYILWSLANQGGCYLGVRRDGFWAPVGDQGENAIATQGSSRWMKVTPHAGNPSHVLYVPKSAGGTGGGNFWIFNTSDKYITLFNPVSYATSHHNVTGLTTTVSTNILTPIYNLNTKKVIVNSGTSIQAIDMSMTVTDTNSSTVNDITGWCLSPDNLTLFTNEYSNKTITTYNATTLVANGATGFDYNTDAGWSGNGPAALVYLDQYDLLWAGQYLEVNHTIIDPTTWTCLRPTPTQVDTGIVAGNKYNAVYVPAKQAIFPACNTCFLSVDAATGLQNFFVVAGSVNATYIRYSKVFDEFYLFDVDSGSFTVAY